MEVSMMYIVYVLSEIGQINDADVNQSKDSTRNLPANIVSQEEVSYYGASNIASIT